jgi:ABC-type nickel/cobalt efflux system permease component RcnA
MKRFLDEHPTLRGFLIIGVIALAIVLLNLYTALATVSALARIAFFLAIAFFVYLMWRERREEISAWPRRALVAFYGAALLIVASFGYYILNGASGLEAVAFLVILGLGGFSMWRIWRDQRHFA